ncbi:lipoprotein insertase outer membrane protein LolB [Neisseria lisongii]|uniref:Outer-membrane lipoprotein LolB n=1 Tax=Neisseria lisongii TaxID=2912188 RepID=A0AAW5AJS8_9NEIS|nr:lipoprotein insertase outer membrane protein LolB [Neisseria lisongii]MCF7528726.1 lipoprotein insertase outer membrane protein LolB [Neisseria lisongii]MCF7529584.1 lipoprotein insertase outer membrane protein LolB [Neisseria lisongii]
MMTRKILPFAAAVLLAACAQNNYTEQSEWPQAQEIDDFAADGRLAVKIKEKGSYANFDWRYQGQMQTVDVNTPLGNTVGKLCQDSLGVLAVDAKGRVYQAQNAAELSSSLLGFELPLQYLHLWASGKRAAGEPYQILADGRLQQSGWNIRRSVGEQNEAKILFLENSKLSIRLVFDDWDKLPKSERKMQCAERSGAEQP